MPLNHDPALPGDDAAALVAILARFDCQAGTVHRLVEGVLQLSAAHHLPPPIVELVRTVPVGKGMAGLAAQTRTPVSLCNLQTDTSGHARPAAKASGMEGSIAVPMLAGAEVRGVLGVAKAVAHDWSEEEKAALLDVAARLALGRPESSSLPTPTPPPRP